MSFITEFMRMGIDCSPVNNKPKTFRYRGELRYPIANKFDPDVCVKISDDGRWCHCEASENDVFKLSGDSDGFCLYVWTGKNTGWQDFHPGPVTDYDGPRPYSDTPNDKLLKYIGETDTNIRDNPLSWLIQIGDQTITPQIGFVATYKDVEYTYVGREKGWLPINDHKHKKEEFTMPVRYERIFPKVNIKNVVFNNPATVVFWDDGTKTVVKCENEEYDPEKGLAMAIAKKALGNQGNYYNQIRKWLPEKEDKPVYTESKEYIETVLVGVQELIVDMTFKGATKAELVRAIKHSKDLIDRAKGADVDIYKSAETYGIVELEEKYQPKSK